MTEMRKKRLTASAGPWDDITFSLLSKFLHAVSYKQCQIAAHEKLTHLTFLCINLPISFNYSVTEGARTLFRIVLDHFNLY